MFGKPKFTELPVPVGTKEHGGEEILRAAIIGESLRISIKKGFRDPITWGVALADVAHHVARMFEQEGACSEQEALWRIAKVFAVEMSGPTDLGTTQKMS